MSKVWDHVVQDLLKYNESKPVVDKPFWQKVWNVVFSNNECNQNCNQGRSCDCHRMINHDNRY